MVIVLVDTSSLYALLDEDDGNHERAARAWPDILDTHHLVTHTYVVVETSALLQRRLGMGAAERLHAAVLPAIGCITVDRSAHDRAVSRWRATRRRDLSLVDVVSFDLMETSGISAAFAFDEDFREAGFELVG